MLHLLHALFVFPKRFSSLGAEYVKWPLLKLRFSFFVHVLMRAVYVAQKPFFYRKSHADARSYIKIMV